MVSRSESMRKLQLTEEEYAYRQGKYLDNLKKSQYYSVARTFGVQISLRKSPLWGGQVDQSKINFEWPTKQMIAEWP